MCRPEFIDYQGKYKNRPYLELRGMKHPCVIMKSTTKKENKKEFIPNDTIINDKDNALVLLVTGPNMGGKSTLLRQTCLGVILA